MQFTGLGVPNKNFAKQNSRLQAQRSNSFSERQADVIRRRSYAGQTMQEAGDQIGVSHNRVRQIEVKALRQLSGYSSLQRWHDEIISTRAWQGTGYGAWKNGGSVEERSVEWLDRELERLHQRAQEQEFETQNALEQWKQARENVLNNVL